MIGGFSDSSISIDTPVININNTDSAGMLAIILQLAQSGRVPLTAEQFIRLYMSKDLTLKYPGDLISEKKLDGYNSYLWEFISKSEYLKSDSYSPPERSLYDVLMRLAIETFKPWFNEPKDYWINILFVGDFSEVSDAINVLIDPQFQISHTVSASDMMSAQARSPQIFLEWNALVPDPYTVVDSNAVVLTTPNADETGLSQIESSDTKLSDVYSLYDSYVGKKWLCGGDGSGLLTKDNISWLAAGGTNRQKYQILIGILARKHYLGFQDATKLYNDSLTDQSKDPESTKLRQTKARSLVNKHVMIYYKLCVSILASLSPFGSAIIKIPLPTSRAIYSIYSLFSMFFTQTRLIRMKHNTPDDDICYLLGSGFYQAPNGHEKLINTLLDEEFAESLLFKIGNQIVEITDLDRLLTKPTQDWINDLAERWVFRNTLSLKRE